MLQGDTTLPVLRDLRRQLQFSRINRGEVRFVRVRQGDDKIGIEEDFLSRGKERLLDPFSPLKDGDKKVAEELLADLHKTFIEAV